MEILCFSPPDNLTPISPIRVSYPFGKEAERIHRLTHRHVATRQHIAPGGTRRMHQLRFLWQVDDIRNPQRNPEDDPRGR